MIKCDLVLDGFAHWDMSGISQMRPRPPGKSRISRLAWFRRFHSSQVSRECEHFRCTILECLEP